jgi:hypothetical protein
MISGKQILAPTTDSSAESDMFEVDERSRVVYIAPDSGETLTEDDAFQLCRVISVDSNDNADEVLPVKEDGAVLTLGANRTQFEVVIRGTYVIQKILATTESVGVYQTYGNDEGS